MSDYDNRTDNGEPIIAGRGPGLEDHVPGAAGRCGAAMSAYAPGRTPAQRVADDP
jgi:hypothetical protein